MDCGRDDQVPVLPVLGLSITRREIDAHTQVSDASEIWHSHIETSRPSNSSNQSSDPWLPSRRNASGQIVSGRRSLRLPPKRRKASVRFPDHAEILLGLLERDFPCRGVDPLLGHLGM